MLEQLVLIIFYCLPFVIIITIERARILSLFEFSAAKVLLISYLVSNHVGLLYLHSNPSINIEPSFKTTLVLLIYSSVLVSAYYLSALIFNFGTEHRLIDRNNLIATPVRYDFLFIFGVFALIFLIGRVIISPLGSVLLENEALGINARMVDYNNKELIFGIFKESYVNILFYAAAAFSIGLLGRLIIKFDLKDFIYFLFFISLYVLYFGANLSKGVLISPFLYLFVIFSVIRNNYRYIGVVSFLTFLVIVVYSSYVSDLIMGGGFDILYFFDRLILGNLKPQYFVVGYFSSGNLLYGASAPSWFSFGLHEQYFIEEHAWKALNDYEGGFFYTAPSSFVSEAHANFSFVGVIIYSFIAFSVCRLFDYFSKSIKSDFLFIGLYVWGVLHLRKVAVSPMISWVFDYYFWGVVFILLVLYRVRIFTSSSRR